MLVGLELRTYTLSHSTSPFFWDRVSRTIYPPSLFFWDKVSRTISWAWLQISLLLISASFVVRITDVSYSHPAIFFFFKWWWRSNPELGHIRLHCSSSHVYFIMWLPHTVFAQSILPGRWCVVLYKQCHSRFLISSYCFFFRVLVKHQGPLLGTESGKSFPQKCSLVSSLCRNSHQSFYLGRNA
jgi:hypothetical protein